MPTPLDFWLGSWVVHDSATGELLGTNRITAVLGGNAVVEEWRGASGVDGMSLFYFDRMAGTWRQAWATSLGYAKRKRQVEAFDDGSVRFEGLVDAPDGTTVRDRTTLTGLGGRAVRQVIEAAAATGGDWHVGFDATYTRADVSPGRNTDAQPG